MEVKTWLLENKKNILICRLLKCMPRVLSINLFFTLQVARDATKGYRCKICVWFKVCL